MAHIKEVSSHSPISRKSRTFGIKTEAGGGFASAGGISQFYELEPAEVIDIILDESHPKFASYNDIGKAKVRMVYSQRDTYDKNLHWAIPMIPNFKDYPLKHEIVICAFYISIVVTPAIVKPEAIIQGLYYFQRMNILNSPNQNIMFGASVNQVSGKVGFAKKTGTLEVTPKPKLGKKFKSQFSKIYPLKAFEGDIIWEGRFGQGIRFGSNLDNKMKPHVYIHTGQKDDASGLPTKPREEDVNKDYSSIWMTTCDKTNVELEKASADQSSWASSQTGGTGSKKGKTHKAPEALNPPSKYIGKQIILNSDRLIFNSKGGEGVDPGGETMFFSKGPIGFSTTKEFNIDATGQTVINSPNIYLGKDATEHCLLGDTTLQWLSDLCDEITKETHPTGVGPSSTPINTPAYMALKSRLPEILSKQNYTK